MDNVEPATRRHHPLARFLYVSLALISSLLTLYFGFMFFGILMLPDSGDAQDALISKATGFWFFLAGTVFFGLVGYRLMSLCDNLETKAGGLLLWLSGVVLALGTMYLVFERGIDPIHGIVIAIVGTLSVLCLWRSNKEPRK